MAIISKNEEILQDFVKYCQTHPEQRFYQALRNWSKYAFIYGSMRQINLKDKDWLEDTFFDEDGPSKLSL